MVSQEQAKSLESILEACKAKGVSFCFPIDNPWYTPSFLWAAGGVTEIRLDADAKPIIYSNFETEEVAMGAEAISDLYGRYGGSFIGSDTFVSTSEANYIADGFRTGTVGACIMYNGFMDIVPENRLGDIRSTVLPSIQIGGEEKSLWTFLGYKALAINSSVIDPEYPEDTDKYELALDFARYFSSPENQAYMLENKGYGPSAASLADHEGMSTNQSLAALMQMKQDGHTVPQGANVTSDFWLPMEEFGDYISIYAASETPWGEYASALECIRATVTSKPGWANME